MLYECIDYIKGTSEDGLTFHGVSLNYATHVHRLRRLQLG